MGLIELYIIFSITTALVALYELIWPVMRETKANKPDLSVSRQWRLTTVVFFVMSVIVAPFLIVPCFSAKKGAEFRKTLYTQLTSAE